jgi:cell surface protein SprA
VPFLFGGQTNVQQRSIENGWLTRDPDLNRPYTQNVQRNLRGQALVEPIDGLRINVNFNRRRSRNTSRTFRYYPDRGVFDTANPPQTNGSYSVSFFSLPTAFIGENNDGISPLFQQFEANRRIIAERLSESGVIDPETQYPKGYSGSSQEVLIPAFIAAYSGQSASDVDLSAFPDMPMPNWRLTYNGLSRLELLEDLVDNISLSHGYQSTYQVNNFSTELRYNPEATVEDLENGSDFSPEYEIPQITINESLSPLIGIDITWSNDWTTRLEFSKTRQLSFRLTNNRLTEVISNTFTIGAGYRTQEFVVPFRIDGEKVVLDNELNFRLDFRIRDNKTTIRRLDESSPEPVSGQTNIEIKPNVNYQINENLRLRIFFNRSITNPATTNSYPRRNTNFGFSLRYTLGGGARGGGNRGGGNRGPGRGP